MKKQSVMGISAFALAALAFGQSAPASAQTSSSTTPKTTRDEVVITGSRLGRTSFDSPTPVNVVGQERAEDLNITNIADALNQIPAFRPLTSPATNSFRSSANIAARTLDLRGLGPIRTLTLVDGRRHVPTGDDSNFDLNTIPSIMVQRSEVVTGGASAAYGAGAVAGVVNLILDTKFTGLKSEVSYGISDQGDAERKYAAFEYGTRFADDRGRFVIGAEYSNEGGVGDVDSRGWSKRYTNYIPNPFFNTNPALSNGLPATVVSDNVQFVLNPAGIVSTASPFQGTQFDKSGNLIPFQFGSLYSRAKPSTLMIGGDPSLLTVYGANGSPLLVANHHLSLLTHAEFQLTDSIVLSGELSWSRAIGGPTGANVRSDQNGALVIRRDNGFLNPSVAAMMDAAGVTTIPVSRSNVELGANDYTSKNTVIQGLISLKGDFFGDWHWDATYAHGQDEGLQLNKNSRLEQRWKDSIDAVKAPAGIPGILAGTIVCRTTLTNPTNGCVPANIMGPGNVSAAASAWANSVAYSTRKYTQDNVSANVRGTLFEGWAGPISAAAGAEYRADSSEGDNDPNSKLGLFSQLSWTQLPSTTQEVAEGYVEMSVPLLKDLPLIKSLDLDGAIRRTHYSLSGDATTWKVGAVYQITDDYMLRVTRSNDIRAPTPEELNPNRRTLTLPLADPKYGVQYIIPTFNGGNPNLKLEQAETFTIGAVAQPGWLPRFKLSIDYYDIKVADAIDLITGPLAVTLCRGGQHPEVCLIGTDTTGNSDRILELYATYQNVNQLHTRGVEVVSDYSIDLADIAKWMSGDLNLSLNGSYVDTLQTSFSDGSKKEFSDFTGNPGAITAILGVPKYRLDGLITYSQPRYSLTAHMSYIPKAKLNPDWIGPEDDGYNISLPNSVTTNRIGSAFYLDLTARVKIWGDDAQNVELFGGVSNALDKAPPSTLRLVGNPLYFDPVGRSYKIGLRANF